MPTKKKTKVKDISKKYKISPHEALKALKGLGMKLTSIASEIDDDLLELAEEHLKEIAKTDSLEEPVSKSSQSAGSETSPGTAGEKEIHLKPPVVVKTLSEALNKKPNEIISALMKMNVLASINQTIDMDVAITLCHTLGYTLVVERREKEEHIKHGVEEAEDILPEETPFEDNPADLVERPPIVTFLGHVDHGKTSLLDAVRKTNIAAGEDGGITQHIGASTVSVNGKTITFIDTPGHEAFTAMRARGANVTDIAVLVVAADDGFMPQTIEALDHAKAAGVPIVVAINKIDLPAADPEKVLRQMQENGLMSEDWGGNVGAVRVSAIKGEGIQTLLERILLEAEMLELKANPKRPAKAVVLEAQLEQEMGPTAHILIQNGTLKKGDVVLCGQYCGRIKTMINEHGKRLNSATPGMPVKLVGLSGVPEAGAKFVVCKSEREARRIAEERAQQDRKNGLRQGAEINLEDIIKNLGKKERNNLRLIIKSDVRGSAEAIIDSLNKFPSEKINIKIIHAGIGAISENDVLLASASQAIIIGFHVRVNPGVNALARKEGVEIRLYSIIYELLEDIREALAGRLAPEEREKELGWAKILQIFNVSKGPKVCGCLIEKGFVRVGAKARVFRNEELIFNGSVHSLRRFQDDVKEVRSGLECGIRLDNFTDFQKDDNIQIYEVEFKKASL